MTPEELQELRDWAARKMGWTPPNPIKPGKWTTELEDYSGLTLGWRHEDGDFLTEREFGDCHFFKDNAGKYVTNWQPDHPESGQIWMLVERMRELGWMMKLLNNVTLDFEQTLYGCDFFNDEGKRVSKGASNPCLAILKAARATED